MLSIRSITLFKQPISCLSILNLEQQKCGLKMHKSEPPPKMTIPTKSKLPVLPKIPAEFTNFYGKVPKGMITRSDDNLVLVYDMLELSFSKKAT